MFYPLFATIFAWTFGMAFSRGARGALWRGWLAVMMLTPVWITNVFFSLTLDLRLAAALAALAGFALNPPARVLNRLVLADLIALALVAFQMLSQYLVGHFGVFTGPEMMRKWLLPYLMGRLFLGAYEDVDKLIPVFCKLAVVLAVVALFEAFAKVNLVNKLLGKSYGVLEAGEGYRMGLKRAQGPLDHPIFFGLMLVLLLPWTLEAFRRARRGQGPRWWQALPALVGGALFCTVSRGPQMAGLLTVLVTVFFQFPKLRLLILTLVVAGGLGALSAREAIKDGLSKWAGEKEEETQMILLDGEEVEYSGTNHRILLFRVYEKALDEVGWLGYGVNLYGIDLEEAVQMRFGSIDNHYILFLLQHGYLALGAFVALGACTVFYLGRVAWRPATEGACLAGALAGAMAGVMAVLFSVWFAPDFGTVWLFSAGLAASFHALPRTAAVVAVVVPSAAPAAVARVRRPGAGPAPLRPVAVPTPSASL